MSMVSYIRHFQIPYIDNFQENSKLCVKEFEIEQNFLYLKCK
jgi:uncharacterized membrane protein